MRDTGRYRRTAVDPCAVVDARGRECYPDILLANQQFHLSLCRTARMPVLLRLVETLWVQCGPLMHGMTRWPVVKPTQASARRDHRSVGGGDSGAARAALQQDIIMSTDALRRYLTDHAERPEWAKRSLLKQASAAGPGVS